MIDESKFEKLEKEDMEQAAGGKGHQIVGQTDLARTCANYHDQKGWKDPSCYACTHFRASECWCTFGYKDKNA